MDEFFRKLKNCVLELQGRSHTYAIISSVFLSFEVALTLAQTWVDTLSCKDNSLAASSGLELRGRSHTEQEVDTLNRRFYNKTQRLKN